MMRKPLQSQERLAKVNGRDAVPAEAEGASEPVSQKLDPLRRIPQPEDDFVELSLRAGWWDDRGKEGDAKDGCAEIEGGME